MEKQKLKPTSLTPVEGNVKFNLKRITAREFSRFLKAARENDMDELCEYMPKILDEIPADWGDIDSPETYAELPYFTHFKRLVELFTVKANEESKN